MEKKYWKSQGILSARKSGNPDNEIHVKYPCDLNTNHATFCDKI